MIAIILMAGFTVILVIPIARAIEYHDSWAAEAFIIILGWAIVYAIYMR